VMLAPLVDVACTPVALQVRVGGVVSIRATVNEQAALLPLLSVALHTTVVVPTLNLEPEEGEHTADLIPAPSVAVGLNVDVMFGKPLDATVL
jgi:hypothetical protein